MKQVGDELDVLGACDYAGGLAQARRTPANNGNVNLANERQLVRLRRSLAEPAQHWSVGTSSQFGHDDLGSALGGTARTEETLANAAPNRDFFTNLEISDPVIRMRPGHGNRLAWEIVECDAKLEAGNVARLGFVDFWIAMHGPDELYMVFVCDRALGGRGMCSHGL
jgi:hypothetical protein